MQLNKEFSIIIPTFNEEIHLPRLLESIADLNAEVFILDSGSTDRTLEIARQAKAITAVHSFENHPKQWDYALNKFEIHTPWIIGLDADQILSPELFLLLKNFENELIPSDVNGIYFNRKNYFKGKWLRFGGYFPRYLLKMFRTNIGKSDLNENMDHRFVVPGRTIIWEKGYLIEENLKENQIAFWIDKHNRYSDLLAEEEVDRRAGRRIQNIIPSWFGSPDQKIAMFKTIWWKLPLFIRPLLYFCFRYFFQLGILDGKRGFIFHFLQAYWFRLVVDIKIYELTRKKK